MTDTCRLDINVDYFGDAICVVSPVGVLDSASYLTLRTALEKAAADRPDAVVVDVDGLDVPVSSAWAVLTSAHWKLQDWPAVPMRVITTRPAVRAALVANGITRYVSVFDSRQAAAHSLVDDQREPRRTARLLPRHRASQGLARELIRRRLTRWGRPEFLEAADYVATELVRNVLDHTLSAPLLRIELRDDRLTIAVADGNPQQPALREQPGLGVQFSGLGVVSLLSHTWGSHACANGKVVWAVLAAPPEALQERRTI